MTTREENWELMSILGMTWSDASSILDEDDRKFLLEKSVEVKAYAEEQHRQAEAQQQAYIEQQQAAQQQAAQQQPAADDQPRTSDGRAVRPW